MLVVVAGSVTFLIKEAKKGQGAAKILCALNAKALDLNENYLKAGTTPCSTAAGPHIVWRVCLKGLIRILGD